MVRFWQKLLAVIVTVVAIMTPTNAAMALSEKQLNLYDQNRVYFYNPNQSAGKKKRDCGGGGGGTIEVGENQNYAGATVWSQTELAAIADNQAIYEEAASEYGFPWQVLATLHSMETSLKRYNPNNGQGVYQLYSYTGGGSNSNRFPPASSITEEEFARQTRIAAGEIVKMVGDLNNPDNVKALFFAYNGKAKRYIDKAIAMGFSAAEAQNGEGSPYVMNRYDAARDPASTEMDSNWSGRFVKDGVYDPTSTSMVFGAYVKYEALGGAEGGGGGYCNDNGSIVSTALLLSWDGKRSHAKDDPKPEYITAMKDVGIYRDVCNGSTDCTPAGASCDVFVGTVMRYSGVDPNFPLTGPGNQKNYMQQHSDMYTQVDVSDVSDLQAGDILVTTENGSHIYINLGNIDGEQMQASASFNDRTGEHFPGVYLSDGGTGNGTRHYTVFRSINNNSDNSEDDKNESDE